MTTARKSSKSAVSETSTTSPVSIDSSSHMTEKNAKLAAKKRAERNKARTSKHVGRMLSLFATGVVRGYEDQDWRYMSQLFRQLSPFLMLEEMNVLGKLWRSSFAEEPTPSTIDNIVGMVAERLGTQFAIDPVLSQRVAPTAGDTSPEAGTDIFHDMTMETKTDENYAVEYVVDDESEGEDAPKASKKSRSKTSWD